MTIASRTVLLIIAMLWLAWGVKIAPQYRMCCPPAGIDFGLIGLGMTFAAPFWIPAITPNRFATLLKWVTWLGLTGALLLVLHAVSSLIAYLNMENAAVEFVEFRRRMIAVYTGLTVASICGFGVLLRPWQRGWHFRRAAPKL